MVAPSSIQTLMPADDAGAGSWRQIEKHPWTLQPADGAGDGGPEEPPHFLDVARFRSLNSLIHRENVAVNELLQLVGWDNRVNLMNDPLLSFVIAYKKPKLAVLLIAKGSDAMLTATNYDGDTALHVAAAMDDKEVASELIRRVPDLVRVQNQKQEIPLHKAALYGLQDMFWLLVAKESSPNARREDGATMLHCAIMGNAPGLAERFPLLITSRNTMAVTPLQLMVIVPRLFRSQMVLAASSPSSVNTLRDLVPKELVYTRNAQEMTAEEMFTESHQVMLGSCKRQLMETGRTCSGLVAAIVFASSFSVPGDKDPATGSPVCFGRAAFKVFSHAYVFGLSCAATSLVLFLSLAMSPYKMQQFRRIIPTKYFFARSSFGLAMLSFLVAFTCNIYLQLYGWQKTKSKDLIPFVLELTVFPVICFLVLFFRGADFGISFLVRLWR